jgi:hypothetical protein
LQERRRAAVLRAFTPIALGHAASIVAVVALVGAAQLVVAPRLVQIAGGAALALFGAYKLLFRAAHPRWVGMRVGFRDLTVWSFLMSTAHGAGLMLMPILLRLAPGASSNTAHAAHSHAEHIAAASAPVAPAADLTAVAVHTAAMFLVMAAIALVVYERVGLSILRRAWFNLDVIWAAALIAAGALTIVAV